MTPAGPRPCTPWQGRAHRCSIAQMCHKPARMSIGDPAPLAVTVILERGGGVGWSVGAKNLQLVVRSGRCGSALGHWRCFSSPHPRIPVPSLSMTRKKGHHEF